MFPPFCVFTSASCFPCSHYSLPRAFSTGPLPACRRGSSPAPLLPPALDPSREPPLPQAACSGLHAGCLPIGLFKPALPAESCLPPAQIQTCASLDPANLDRYLLSTGPLPPAAAACRRVNIQHPISLTHLASARSSPGSSRRCRAPRATLRAYTYLRTDRGDSGSRHWA